MSKVSVTYVKVIKDYSINDYTINNLEMKVEPTLVAGFYTSANQTYFKSYLLINGEELPVLEDVATLLTLVP